MSTAFVNHAFFGRIERDLLRMAAVDRAPAMKKAMGKAVRIVAQRTRDKLPEPGYEGDKPGKPPLSQSVGIRVYQDDATGGIVGRVKWRRPGGSHGHLVEAGHTIVRGGTLKKRKSSRVVKSKRNAPFRKKLGTGTSGGRVVGRRHLANAWSETRIAQHAALDAGVKEYIAGKK